MKSLRPGWSEKMQTLWPKKIRAPFGAFILVKNFDLESKTWQIQRQVPTEIRGLFWANFDKFL